MTRLKLNTRPAITRYGRRVSESVGLGLTAVRHAARAGLGGPSVRAVCAPEKKITGRTGRMHGEMPVIKPPRKPMRRV